MTGFIDIVFDGPPSHESGRFVEVEDADGKSISIGEWVVRPGDTPGWAALRIPDPRPVETVSEEDYAPTIASLWGSPEYDPRNPSATPMMIEAGFLDLIAVVRATGDRIGDAIDAHAMELGRQRS